MSRRRLGIGERGDISYSGDAGRVTASLYFRDHRGQRRRLKSSAPTKAAARRQVLAALDEALRTGGVGDYSTRTTFSDVAEQWFAAVQDLADRGRRSPTTVELYRRILDVHVLPGVGSLRLNELSTARMDHFIQLTLKQRGYATAKLCRTVLSGVCGHAVRRDAMRFNPVRDVSPLEADAEKEARALTIAECGDWLQLLDSSEYARRKDLPDLVRFLLGTGMRVGEALGVTWPDVDLDTRLIHVRRTIVRLRGGGLIAKPPKTASGVRVLQIPGWLVELLAGRKQTANPLGPVFPDSLGGWRDRNNVERDHRVVREGTPFQWVVPHTYRKTVATMLDQTGLSARTIADQLGHSRISMTQDVYLGRRAVDTAAAFALEGLWQVEPGEDEDPPRALARIV